MRVLVEMVSDGDFTAVYGHDGRLVTVAEMDYAISIVESEETV